MFPEEALTGGFPHVAKERQSRLRFPILAFQLPDLARFQEWEIFCWPNGELEVARLRKAWDDLEAIEDALLDFPTHV
jgi:hypothetical protein